MSKFVFAVCGCVFLLMGMAYHSGAQQPNDFFWSPAALNEGAVNADIEMTIGLGQEFALYLYWSTNGPLMSEMDTGAFIDITLAGNYHDIEILSVETFDYNIVTAGDVIGCRWVDSFGPGIINCGGRCASFNAFSILGGFGMLDDHTGPVVFDDGYDEDAEAFLFAKATLRCTGICSSFLGTTVGSGGILHQGMTLRPTFNSVFFSDCNLLCDGDLNGDGTINLLDIAPFVQALSTGTYHCQGDFNDDGVVDLLDVSLFVNEILNPSC